MLNHSQTHARDLAEQMGQRLKVTEALLAEAVKARERLVADNESVVEGLISTIKSKDQLLKVGGDKLRGDGTCSCRLSCPSSALKSHQESAELANRKLSERSQEIEDLRRLLSERQQQLAAAERQNSQKTQEGCLEAAELKALLAEKDSLISVSSSGITLSLSCRICSRRCLTSPECSQEREVLRFSALTLTHAEHL